MQILGILQLMPTMSRAGQAAALPSTPGGRDAGSIALAPDTWTPTGQTPAAAPAGGRAPST